MAKLDAARQRVAKDTDKSPAVTLCYEAGYDGFWLARFLEQRDVTCQVMEPASLQVNRRARRVKTDRIDVERILHALIAWCRGERHVCSMVVIPSVEEEGIRGINVKSRYKTLKPSELVTGDGRPLPDRLGREITREIERLAQVQVQIVAVERERGYKMAITNHVPSDLTKGSTSGTCSAMIYGDFAQLVMAFWSSPDVLVDPYTGGSAGTTRIIVHQDLDVGVRHAQSFAACLDLTTT